MTHHIHNLVDQLLLEQGEYRPLEFLLQEGRLSYADYEAWRNGELDFLDEALFGDPDHIQQDLLQAEEYLQRRGWQAETLSYEAWRRHAQAGSHPLRFSANTDFDARFHRRFFLFRLTLCRRLGFSLPELSKEIRRIILLFGGRLFPGYRIDFRQPIRDFVFI